MTSLPVVVPSEEIYEVEDKVYYDSVILQFDTGNLKVFVGDTVVIPCQEAKKEPKATWYPWKDDEPWSAIQILSLYKDVDSEYMMDFRWFWRYSEVPKKDEKCLRDAPIEATLRFKNVIESNVTGVHAAENIIGLAVVTAQNEGFLNFAHSTTTRSRKPVPIVALQCRSYLDFSADPKVFKTVNDWSGSKRSSAYFEIMLFRGLTCLSEDRRKSLVDHFVDHFESRQYPGQRLLSKSSTKHSLVHKNINLPKKRSKVSPATSSLQHVGHPSVKQSDALKSGTSFYTAATVPVYLKKCVSRLVSKIHNESWRVSIGDIVCVQRDDEKISGTKTSSGCVQWHPFKVPWTCCQVLSIYEKEGEVLLEIRWLPRVALVDKETLSDLNRNFKDDEVFETVVVESGVPTSNILGRVDLLLGHHVETGEPMSDHSTIPTVRLRCRFLFYEDIRRVQPLFCGDTSPRMWRQRLLERGMKSSPLIKRNDLNASVTFCLGIFEKAGSIFAELQPSCATITEDDKGSVLWSDDTEELLISATITPPWHSYADVDNVCHMDDRDAQVWKVHVGDLVAACKKDSNFAKVFDGSPHQWFPFNVNWCPCQIVSISRRHGELLFEVRWLLGSSDLTGNVSLAKAYTFDRVYESKTGTLSLLRGEYLLGPVCLSSTRQDSIQPFLPHCIIAYGGLWSCEDQKLVRDQFSVTSMLERSIQLSSTYEARFDKALLLYQVLNQSNQPLRRKLKCGPSCFERQDDVSQAELSSATSLTPSPESAVDRISSSVAPFHVDKSSLRAYVTEMEIKAPCRHYACKCDNQGSEWGPWKVKVGDIVVVHYEHGAGKAFFDVTHEQTNANYPFKQPWAVAEIVLIWKTFTCIEDLPSVSSGEHLQTGDLEMEIRWVWRRCELPGVAKPGASQKQSQFVCEEVFETDHIDRCTAESILAPAEVHFSDVDFAKPALYHLGMPVLQFRCNRFWSFHRKSVVPFAAATGRHFRSRMYSVCLSQDHVLKNALERFEKVRSEFDRPQRDEAAIHDNKIQSWQNEFRKVIDKLSLTQASTDAFEKGVTLLGRDREWKEITSFLRGAISSANKFNSNGSICPSMFIAGSPGTGKTISVSSIIGKLRYDKIDGRIPDFDFFSLNGMEMRHPFEAYVKFWELISGPNKERLTPEMAASKLERYFSGLHVKNAPKRSVIVLVLDEIDYLMTKKETVLYNFFDWPKRSFETTEGPRLVVIGISNTVDLPSKLKASVRSRLGGTRCDFKAYNVQDIVRILEDKIQPATSAYVVFDKDAILFAAKKVAAVSGDIRKALQICKAAAEAVMYEAENGTRMDPKLSSDCPTIRVRDVQRVTREKMGSVITQALVALAPLEALVLVAVSSLCQSSGGGAGGCDIDELMTKTLSIANASGELMYLPPPSFSELLIMLEKLGDSRLIRMHTEKSSISSFRCSRGGSGGAWPMILSGVDSGDILVALRKGIHSELVEKHLGGFMF